MYYNNIMIFNIIYILKIFCIYQPKKKKTNPSKQKHPFPSLGFPSPPFVPFRPPSVCCPRWTLQRLRRRRRVRPLWSARGAPTTWPPPSRKRGNPTIPRTMDHHGHEDEAGFLEIKWKHRFRWIFGGEPKKLRYVMDFCFGGVVVEFFYSGFHMFSCCVVFIFPLRFFWSDVFFVFWEEIWVWNAMLGGQNFFFV